MRVTGHPISGQLDYREKQAKIMCQQLIGGSLPERLVDRRE